MKQFDLSVWLKDKSQKICTRDGRPVRIVCTDRKGKSGNIVGLVGENEASIYVWNNNGKHIVSGDLGNNLVFAEEEDDFSELRESEDRKWRNWLIGHLKGYINQTDDKYAEVCKKAIAWLEKQGEKDLDIRYSILDKLIEADDIYQMSVNDAMIGEARNKAISALSKLEVYKSLELEKKSEQKPASEDLEEEVGKYTTNHLLKKRNHSTGVYHLTQKDCDDIAHHFAEWQREKDIKLEKIDDLEEFAQKWAYSNYHEELDEVNCDCLYSGVKKGAEWQKQKSMQDFLEKAEKILTERMYFSDDEAKEFKNYMKKEA